MSKASDSILAGLEDACAFVGGDTSRGRAHRMPTEHSEQAAVATWLRARGVAFFAVPNGAKMGAAECAKMKREGLSVGVPDLFVFDRGLRLALEMKRRKGGCVSADQLCWLEHLKTQGFAVFVAHGAEEAIAWLQQQIDG